MALTSGTRLGPYEIESPLGAGGMGGEVYRARDVRLDRIVALKILPAHLSSDNEFKQRFEREARTVSSLNHRIFASFSTSAGKAPPTIWSWNFLTARRWPNACGAARCH